VEFKDLPHLSKLLPCFVLIDKSLQELDGHTAPDELKFKSWQPARTVRLYSETMKPLEVPAEQEFTFGENTVNFLEMTVKRKGRTIPLTALEFKALKFFATNPRRVLSRDELLDQVWGYENYPCTRTVDNHILRLRKKLEKNPARPVHFLTVHAAGYKFLP
jgi:DNA-binding response OmpR family regulator